MIQKLNTRHVIGGIEDIGTPVKADMDIIQEKFVSITPGWADKSIKPILSTRGWMSKGSMDRMDDIIDPAGWVLDDFLKYPVFMFHHSWGAMLLGIWTDIEIRKEGLYGRNVIYGTKQGEDAALLIRAGVYRSYSVGFNALEYSLIEDGGYHFHKQELIETSLVPSPGHSGATIETVEQIKNADLLNHAKEHNLTLKYFSAQKSKRKVKDMEVTKEVVDSQIADAMKKQTEVTVAELGTKFVDAAQFQSQMKQLTDKTMTEADTKTLMDNITADFVKKMTDLSDEVKAVKKNKTVAVPGLSFSPDRIKSLLQHTPGELKGSLGASQADNLITLQEKQDALVWLDRYKSGQSESVGGDYHRQPKDIRMKSLPIWNEFNDFAKSMATSASGQGTEWVPAGWSGKLLEIVRAEANVAALFAPFVPMVNKTLTVPQEGADTYWDLCPETTTVPSSVNSDEQDILTGNMTFTAKKFKGRYFISGEETEDSIIAIMPHARDKMARGAARTLNDAIINSNGSSPFSDAALDSGYTRAATHRQRAFSGLRYLWFQIINAGSAGDVKGIDGGTFSANVMTQCRGQMGKYGLKPNQLAWLTSVQGYLLRLLSADEMPEVMTMDKYGPNAVVAIGELAKIFGSPIVPMSQIADDLDATGIYSASGNTRTMMMPVRTDMFSVAERKDVEILTERDIHNYGYNVVGYARYDFQPNFTPSSTECFINAIYNVDAAN